MSPYYLGADLGATKTHVLVTDERGAALGFGKAGPGNHESVGYSGFKANLTLAATQALSMAGLAPAQISGAGFGIGGYDWPMERNSMLRVIRTLHLGGAVEVVNDAELGILTGSPRGWGVAVVSGTGCNCRGWDETRQHRGRVTGSGLEFGEAAGASELMFMVTRAISHAWSGRGPQTALTGAFVEEYHVKDVEDLLQQVICHRIEMDASAAPLVFQVAAAGDPVALELVRWAGSELGALALTVIRQLHFERLEFDLVQIGGMWDGSPLLTEEMQKVVWAAAPGANFIRLKEPPVMGAVLLGMEAAGVQPDAGVRAALVRTIPFVRNGSSPEAA
jgi:N-acetylglucosamine kinase-like BadF-type ATPase